MPSPLQPDDEQRRLEALRRYELLDTLPEQALDDLTTLASHICETPIALISLADEHRQWFKSKIGMPVSESPRDASFSAHAIGQRGLFIVPDASQDARFADGPLVAGTPHIRFYAGAPLVTPDGLVIGTLCVMDRVPRQLTPSQQDALRMLGRQVMAQLELRRQTRELIDSETRLRIVTDNAHVGLVVVSPDRRYLYANAAYADILGLPSSAIVGQRVKDVLPALYDEQIAPRLDRAFAGERVTYELQRPTADGHRYYSVRYEPTKVPGPAALVVVVVITEITDHREAQRALSRLAAIVESSADAIIGKNLDGIVTSWNSGAEKIFGYTAAEMVGTSILRLIPSDRLDEENLILERIRRGEGIAHFETVRRTKDGRLIDVSVTASPIKDASGRVIGASKVARDISERKQALEALRTAEERMRFALQSADVGIWDVDYATGRVQWSEILEAQYGLRPGTFEGTFEAFVARTHPDDRQPMLETIESAARSGVDFAVQYRAMRPDGTVRWLSGAGRVLLDKSGAPVRAIGISLDITERRTLEQQYHQAQKMEAVGRLAAGVAHDFNNLLTVILGFCELSLDALAPDDPRRADVMEIHQAGEQAASLTRQLLAFSRKQIIEPAVLDLNGIVANVRPMLERLIGEDVKIELGLRPELARVKADRGQVEQIIMNLAVNARDAMPNGGTLTIETANVELDEQYPRTHLAAEPGRYVALTMTDTGTGMTPEVQARLFEPFFTTKEAGKGTGLGMATVHGIVARSGGSVGVYSEVGKGTSFKVYLPATDVSETVVEVSLPSVRQHGASATVLLVEDSDGLRALAKRLLEGHGYVVLVAANANEALRLFEANASIDVLLTDVVMPGASGPELTRQLVERRPSLRVLYMSGYTEDTITRHGVLNPGIAFLQKPFTSETLARKIRGVLDQ